MKIKRKKLEHLQAQLAQLERMVKTQIIVTVKGQKIIDTDMESMAITARFAGPDHQEWIDGIVTFTVVAPEHASGYEYFLVNKYSTPDPPWNVFQKVTLTEPT